MHPKHRPASVAAFLARKEREIYDRFWARVRKTPTCWLWTGPVDDFGYGRSRQGDASPRSHRFAYEMEYGPIPDGVLVCHRCDVPACVRPSHLWLGSKTENNADRDAKGRGKIARKGEDNPRARLTADQVREIRRRWTGAPGQARALMTEYRITSGGFYAILKGTHWKHLDPNGRPPNLWNPPG